jgi:hypothetical protein
MSMKAALVAALAVLSGCNLLNKAGMAFQNVQAGNNAPLGFPENPQPNPPNPPQPPAPGQPNATPAQKQALTQGFHPHEMALESDPANHKISALQLIGRDPTLLGDEQRLTQLLQPMGQVAEQQVTEFDPNRLHPPGDPESAQNDALLREGWSIAKVGWDPVKKVYVLNWVRIVPAPPR